MSLTNDEYASSYGAASELLKQQLAAESVSEENAARKEGDSYVSTIGSPDEVIPCENYNDILPVIRRAKAETVESGKSAEEAGDAEAASGEGGSGGSSESEEKTTTEVVVINGLTYLETTTVINGVTSVQRTQISAQGSEENADRVRENEAEQTAADK